MKVPSPSNTENVQIVPRPNKNAVTLRDVASRAGVNATTVSVVLNGNRSGTRVSASTRERILVVAQEMGYRPNSVARGMKHRRMKSIGVVDVMHSKGLNLYFLEVLNGILEKAAEFDQTTTVFTVSDWSKDQDKILRFCDGRIDGLIFIAPQFSNEFASELYLVLPFVALHSNLDLSVAISLEIDDEAGGYLATKHLIDLGHRRIVHFAGPELLSGSQRRVEGFARALREANINRDASAVVFGEFESDSGKERARELLVTRTELPTAIFCANDAIAVGVIEELSDAGISIPGTISVVGFDDSLAARMTHPPMTSIRQPFRELGQHAVVRLMQQIDHQGSISDGLTEMGFVKEVFPVELITRESTGAPR